MVRPLLFDFYCCEGGCSTGYERAGFEVVGVDHVDRPRYPFPFLRADALEALDALLAGAGLTFSDGQTRRLSDATAVHASPPCQHYSQGTKGSRTSDNHPDLVEPTRQRLLATGLPYVMENVVGAPMLAGHVVLCGTMFDLEAEDPKSGERLFLRRHRLFESNVVLHQPAPCPLHRPQARRADRRRRLQRRLGQPRPRPQRQERWLHPAGCRASRAASEPAT